MTSDAIQCGLLAYIAVMLTFIFARMEIWHGKGLNSQD